MFTPNPAIKLPLKIFHFCSSKIDEKQVTSQVATHKEGVMWLITSCRILGGRPSDGGKPKGATPRSVMKEMKSFDGVKKRWMKCYDTLIQNVL